MKKLSCPNCGSSFFQLFGEGPILHIRCKECGEDFGDWTPDGTPATGFKLKLRKYVVRGIQSWRIHIPIGMASIMPIRPPADLYGLKVPGGVQLFFEKVEEASSVRVHVAKKGERALVLHPTIALVTALGWKEGEINIWLTDDSITIVQDVEEETGGDE